MARSKNKGVKFERVSEYKRKPPGGQRKTRTVRAHIKSTIQNKPKRKTTKQQSIKRKPTRQKSVKRKTRKK
jgi:hypothetical protein